MNPMRALVQREWLQHRRAWLLLAGVPLVLGALLLGLAQIQFDPHERPPLVVLPAMAAAVLGAVLFLLFAFAGMTTAVGLARRDHGDRSIEFWLSLPVSHLRALLVPLAVHLLVLPLLAAALGAAVGFALSPLLVARVAGPGELAALPWGPLAGAVAVGIVRLTAGWPLALLWLAPLVIVPMVAFAWARRWGLFLLGVAFVAAKTPLASQLALAWLPPALDELLAGAFGAIVSRGGFSVGSPEDPGRFVAALGRAPLWLFDDVARSLHGLASPWLLGAVGVGAAGIAVLVHWRGRGISAAA